MTVDKVPHGIEISLDGRPYIVDLTQYRRRTLPALRDQFDTAQEPGEQSLSSEGLWRRSCNDWSGGEGQLYYDDPDSDRTAFYQSSNIDIWTKGEISLLPQSSLRKSSTNDRLHLLATGSYLYFGDGTTLMHTSNPDADVPTFTSSSIQAGQAAQAIQDLDDDGAYVYAALGANGVTRTLIGASTSTKISTYAATLIEYSNGRIIVSNGNNVTELTSISGGTSTQVSIWNHPNPGFKFTDVQGGPRGIYLAGRSGERSEIYIVRVNEADGSLKTPIMVTDLPTGEYVLKMTYYGGALVIGTNLGFRVASIQEDGSLVYGPRVDVEGGVTAFASEGEHVWFSWSAWPQEEPTGTLAPHRSGVGRMSLARFSEPLVPVYTTDIMAGTVGAPQTSSCVAVARLGGHTYFTLQAVGLYGQSSAFETSGYVWSGWIRYGLTESKVVSNVQLRHEPLVGHIAVASMDETLNVTEHGKSSQVSSLSPGRGIRIENNVGEAVMLKLTLTQGGVEQTPVLKRWTMLAIPTPRRIDEILLPIVLRETVTYGDGDGQRYYFDTKDEFDRLKVVAGAGVILPYVEGKSKYLVYLDRLEEQPEGWNSQKTFFNGLLVLRLLVVGADD